MTWKSAVVRALLRCVLPCVYRGGQASHERANTRLRTRAGPGRHYPECSFAFGILVLLVLSLIAVPLQPTDATHRLICRASSSIYNNTCPRFAIVQPVTVRMTGGTFGRVLKQRRSVCPCIWLARTVPKAR